jgi:hypothetical protein
VELVIRKVCQQYRNVSVSVDSTSIDLGLLDKHERWDLALKLIDAASDLVDEQSDVYKILKELGIDLPTPEDEE